MGLQFKTDCLMSDSMNAASDISSFRSIIRLWPSADAMAHEIGASPFATRKWAGRDRIPAEWWTAVLSSDRVRGAGVTADLLTELAARNFDGVQS